ncbi:MAG: hypothetical protein ABIP94_11540 [Planctomycetota bacterium]
MVCLAALQQFQVTPFPSEVGQQARVSAKKDGAPLAGLSITLETPDGVRRPLGVTGADGSLLFFPQAVGSHVVSGDADGVRILAPFRVVADAPGWRFAFGSVPLGLALLWWNLRRWKQGRRNSARRDPAEQ